MEIPPIAHSDALNDVLNADETNNKQLRDAEGISQSQRESAGLRPREIGNLTLLPLFELRQITMQLETFHLALSFILDTPIVKNKMNPAR